MPGSVINIHSILCHQICAPLSKSTRRINDGRPQPVGKVLGIPTKLRPNYMSAVRIHALLSTLSPNSLLATRTGSAESM